MLFPLFPITLIAVYLSAGNHLKTLNLKISAEED